MGDWLDPYEVTALDLYEAHPLLGDPAAEGSGRSTATPNGESVGLLPNVQYLRLMGIGSFATEDLLDDIMLRSGVCMDDAVAIFTVPFRTSWTAEETGDTLGFRRYYAGSRSHRFHKVVFVANQKPNLGGSVFEFNAEEVDFVLIPPMGLLQPTQDEGEARRLRRIAAYWQTLIDKLRRFSPRTKFTIVGIEAWGGGWLERAARQRSENFDVITRNEYRRRVPREEFNLVTTALADLRAVYPAMWPDPSSPDMLSDDDRS